MDKLWKIFTETGKVEDYLAYRSSQSRGVNADSKRNSNKRTSIKGQ